MTDRGDWISTYSGRPFWPCDPRIEDVRLADIAHALSQLCRFAGHTRTFYSVAQHAVLVSGICPPEDAKWGLLHDASEAYLCDLTRPLKHTPELAGYRTIEAAVQGVICDAFSLPRAEPPSVKAADLRLLRTEQRDLMVMPPTWTVTGEPLSWRIEPWSPDFAERAFLARFGEVSDLHELNGGAAVVALNRFMDRANTKTGERNR